MLHPKWGLELLDVADVARQYPEVIEYFEQANDDTFFDDLMKLKGGKAVADSIKSYLKKIRYALFCRN